MSLIRHDKLTYPIAEYLHNGLNEAIKNEALDKLYQVKKLSACYMDFPDEISAIPNFPATMVYRTTGINHRVTLRYDYVMGNYVDYRKQSGIMDAVFDISILLLREFNDTTNQNCVKIDGGQDILSSVLYVPFNQARYPILRFTFEAEKIIEVRH